MGDYGGLQSIAGVLQGIAGYCRVEQGIVGVLQCIAGYCKVL